MKYIICLLFFFTASCVSARKYHRTAQKITDWAQGTIDSIQAPGCPRGDTIPPDLRFKNYYRHVPGAISVQYITVDNYYDVFIGGYKSCNQIGITVFWDEGKIRIIDFKTKDTMWNYRSDTYKREKSYNSPVVPQSPKKKKP